MIFYIKRLRQIADLISSCEKYGDGSNSLLVRKEEKRLENINEEDFKKEDKFADVELKELSAKEMLNDPWFNKEIDNFFGLENGKLPKEKLIEKESNNNTDYKSWTKEQLIAEINRLKAENEELKNNQILTASEKQGRLQKNQKELKIIQSVFDSNNTQNPVNNSKNNFPTSWIIEEEY